MIAKIVTIERIEDYLKLREIIPEAYLSTNVMNLFQESLSSIVKTVIVEYPYVDKDYRSTYYGFYSKRHRAYSQFCYRLHLFEKPLESEKDLSEVSDVYLGSIVLRPTEVTTLGRTLLSPRAIRDFNGFVCEANFENNLLGAPLKVKTFPHIMQDTDVTVCAHAVCWMIARYYSEKQSVYPERLAFDIAEAVKDFSGGRIIPSRGLTLGQVSEVLASIGFHPEIFIRNLYDDKDIFYDLLYCYVESGIPVVGAMSGKEHAVAILGHGTLRSASEICNRTRGTFVNVRHCSDRLIMNNDNCLPFAPLLAQSGQSGQGTEYFLDDVDAFVVPQYEKTYLNAENVLKLYPRLAAGGIVEIPEKQYMLRVYMTSSRSYKRNIRNSSDINDMMRQAQLEIPMPKFIWIIELAAPEHYDQMKTDFRWLIDATANQYESFPFLVVHDHKKLILHDRALTGNMYRVGFSEQIQPYALYENNLRRY